MEVIMKEFKLKSFDGTEIACYLWDEVKKPIGIVQIAHGMGEHCPRYDHFATYLNNNGYIVIADDHRGHGKTCGYDNRGIVEGDSFGDTISDMIHLTAYAKEKYKLPLLLLGHSYGSFLSQGYIQKNGANIAGVVLSGSAYMNIPLTKIGKAIAMIQAYLFGNDKPAKLIGKMSFGAYDKPFAAEKQAFAWLSRDPEVSKKYIADPFCGARFAMSLGFQVSFFKGLGKIYTLDGLNAIPKTLPVLIVSGDKDPVGADGKLVTRLYEEYKTLGLAKTEFKLYPEARHEILNETNKEEVYSDILSFINKVFDVKPVEAVEKKVDKPAKAAKEQKVEEAPKEVEVEVVAPQAVEAEIPEEKAAE
ncbi:MAG: alpha/beta hydrolase [Clostridia bacterium]|nr:alpha/beta hydrolase [Clostridia bacterium]